MICGEALQEITPMINLDEAASLMNKQVPVNDILKKKHCVPFHQEIAKFLITNILLKMMTHEDLG